VADKAPPVRGPFNGVMRYSRAALEAEPLLRCTSSFRISSIACASPRHRVEYPSRRDGDACGSRFVRGELVAQFSMWNLRGMRELLRLADRAFRYSTS